MVLDVRLAEALGLALGVWLFVWLTVRFLSKRIDKPPFVSLLFFSLALGLWIGVKVFYDGEIWVGHVGAVLIFAMVVFFWALFDRIVMMGLLLNRAGLEIPKILRQFGGFVVVLIAFGSILKWGYGLKVTALLATSGIAAVILGFALQDLLSNVIAGFSIHMTRAYKVGDWLLLNTDGKRAEVREITWRSTRLLDNDRISYELPNSELVKSQIVNLNYPTQEHGVRLSVGLDYDTPPALAKEVLLKITKQATGVLAHPEPVVFTKEFADSSILYEIRFFMQHARLYNQTCDEIRTGLWYELGRRNMRIPFPIRTLDVRTPNVPQNLETARERAADILGKGSIFSCLSEGELKQLVSCGRMQVFGPNEPLVTREEAGDSMFLVLEGSVEVIGRTVARNSRVVLAKLGAGESFGEMSLLTGAPRNATVRAVGDVLVLEIRKAHLAPILRDNEELSERLSKQMEDRKAARDEGLHKAERENQPIAIRPEDSQRSLVSKIRNFFTQDNS